MTNRMLSLELLLILTLLYMQNAVGRSIVYQNYLAPLYSGWTPSNPGFLGADVSAVTDLNTAAGFGYAGGKLSAASFRSILFNQLIENNVFCNLFSRYISVDIAVSFGLAVAQAIVAEIGQVDCYWATNLLINTLTSTNPAAGRVAFGRAIASVVEQIVLNSSILNSANSFSLAKRLSNIIIKCASTLYGDAVLGNGSGIGADVGLGAVLGAAANLDGRFGRTSDINRNLNGYVDNIGIGNFINNVDFDAKAGSGVGIDAGLGIGASVGVGSDAGIGVGLGTGIVGGAIGGGLGVGIGGGLGAGIGDGLSAGVGAVLSAGVGLGVAIGAGIETGLDVEAGLGVAGGLGLEDGLGVGSSLVVSAGAAIGTGSSIGTNLDDGVATYLDVDVDLTVSADSIAFFETELVKELLNDKYFRYIFSEYIPISVLNGVAAAIAQYLAKAFGVMRSSFLPLEKNILILAGDKAPTLDTYASVIAVTASTILKDVNIITNSAAALQVTMAAKAISSAINNFLGIFSIPGVGVSITSNTYNSFFSVLNGLGKLPYVGTDDLSRKLPPILKTAKSSSFALQFTKILFYNLLSSSRFIQSFSLGVPPSTYKAISNALGNFMAEAFGTLNSSIFAVIYSKALLSTCDKLNYKTYARTLSVATARALYYLGYFLSGNVTIQAAIATNAILRALVTRTRLLSTEVALFPAICKLPWAIQLTGVAPPDSFFKLKAKVGLDADLEANLDVGLDADLTAEVGLDVEAGLGAGASLGLGVGAGFGVGIGAEVGLSANVETGIGAEVDASVGATESGFARSDIPFDLDFDEAELFASLEADIKAEAAVETGLNVDTDATANFMAGLDVDATATADLDVGANVDANLDVGANVDDDLDVASTIVGLGLGINAGLDLGVGSNVGVGLSSGETATSNQVSVLKVLPQILANRLYKSTALFTSITIVGTRKVITLIAQAIAVEFGFPIASIFLKSYNKNLGSNTDNNFVASIVALASATADFLAVAGILDSTFTVLTANQLSIALVARYSSLIVTSLESREWRIKPVWTYVYDQNQFEPLLGIGCTIK